ncbi:shikimate kinase [Synechococcus sp. M16CYN]|uniref:shikimate kinase n=1 Tax=Synechococcus sp. M16CYN TaxID=3103139 RepID=UPI0032525950
MADSAFPLKQRLGGRSLYLVGMMGSGKTETGRPLAKQLGYSFVDADAVIEQVADCTIPEIFKRDGETGFRLIESQVLSAISKHHSLVVATGGGIVTKSENWGLLHSGIVIWLNVGQDRLLTRLEADPTTRPLLPKADLKSKLNEILNHRRRFYCEADLIVMVDGEAPDAVAVNILKLLPSLLRDPIPTQRREINSH